MNERERETERKKERGDDDDDFYIPRDKERGRRRGGEVTKSRLDR